MAGLATFVFAFTIPKCALSELSSSSHMTKKRQNEAFSGDV